jgi:hypothetical protein
MKNNHLFALVAAGAVLGTLAWLSSRERTPAASARIGAELLPDLDVNTVDEIMVSTATETARVVRAESGWQLPERYYYPASFETIRQLMLNLDRLEIGQVITANGQQREKMELSDAAATVIRLKAAGQQVAEIALGAMRQPQNAEAGPYGFGGMPEGRYVAINNDPSVYLISDMLYEAAAQQQRWLDSALLDVSPEAVSSVTIENPADGTFRLRKGTDGKLDFDPADKAAPFDDSKAFTLTGALSDLAMQDVADPVLADEALGFTGQPRRFRVEATDGTRYDVRIGEPVNESGDRHIRIAVGFEAPPVPAVAEGDDAAAKAADSIISAEEAKAKADALHAKLSPWTFRIASYKAGNMTPTRESLIKKPEPPPAAVEESGTSGEPAADAGNAAPVNSETVKEPK